MLFNKVFYNFHVSTICGIEQRVESLTISLINPFIKLPIETSFIAVLLCYSPIAVLFCLMDVYFNEINMPLIGKLMQNIIALQVVNCHYVDIRILI